MEKAAKVLAVVIVIQLLLVSIGIFSNLHHDRWYFSGENRPIEYIETPEPLEPRDHTISQVEDLFIAFEYEHNMSCTFVMTQNFTELTIILQSDWKLANATGCHHEIEIDGTAKVLEYEFTYQWSSCWCTREQYTCKIVGLRYNATYTLTFTGGSGVAVAV